MSTTGAPIVVGVDGSAEALHAVHYAAQEAAWRHAPLRIVHAFIWPLFHVPLDTPEHGPPEAGLRNQAKLIVEHATDTARAAQPGLDITGAPAQVLTAESHTADLIVIGDRGLGGFTGLLVGSVAVQTTTHATCPVLIVKGDTTRTGPVVVGIDGSTLSDHAIDYAFREATWRGAPLRAVHAWQPAGTVDDDQHLRDEPRLLAHALTPHTTNHPDVIVERLTVPDRPTPALLDAAADAELLVVGSRGRGGFTGLLLGSTSHALLHHAPCPIAIVRNPEP
ncbi:universal stress protein [Micromonospora aurantiaca]|uniref:universal stress protein n=1 Tax=Micromonospora aurantiaca (nom. illeg.) TaxID=47850 RepID=UPI000F3D19CF|nr:universal stress protein [Micromonospora aurantiaca]RNH93513.1 universal stress protein [Micromonospora aurantiaca]